MELDDLLDIGRREWQKVWEEAQSEGAYAPGDGLDNTPWREAQGLGQDEALPPLDAAIRRKAARSMKKGKSFFCVGLAPSTTSPGASWSASPSCSCTSSRAGNGRRRCATPSCT